MGDVDGDGVDDIAICEIPYGEDLCDNHYCCESRVYIFKGDTSVVGDTGSVGVKNEKNIIKGFNLFEPYPNPFNPTTTIRFDIPERTAVELAVFNILGQKVKTLISSEVRNPGRYEISFNGGSLASGVYIYRLVTQNYSQARKMLIVK